MIFVVILKKKGVIATVIFAVIHKLIACIDTVCLFGYIQINIFLI